MLILGVLVLTIGLGIVPNNLQIAKEMFGVGFVRICKPQKRQA